METNLTLKEAYRNRKELKLLETKKVINEHVISHKKILENSNSIKVLSEKIQKMEEASLVVPALHKFLTNHVQNLISEGFETGKITKNFSDGLKFYSALSELVKGLQEKRTRSLKEMFYESSLAVCLISKNNIIPSKIFEEIESLKENDINSLSESFPSFPLILSEQEINEIVTAALNRFSPPPKPNLAQVARTVDNLRTIVNKLGGPNDFIKTKGGINSFVAKVKKESSTAQQTAYDRWTDSTKKVFSQAQLIINMFQILAQTWPMIRKTFEEELTGSDPQHSSATIQDFKNAIKQQIDVGVKGGAVTFITKLFGIEQRTTYPEGLSPEIIADELVELLQQPGEEQKAPEQQQQQTQPQQVQEDLAKLDNMMKSFAPAVVQTVKQQQQAQPAPQQKKEEQPKQQQSMLNPVVFDPLIKKIAMQLVAAGANQTDAEAAVVEVIKKMLIQHPETFIKFGKGELDIA